MTGIPFELSTGRGNGGADPWAPSLDQMDPSIGYTPENTRVVVWMFNAAKHIGTDADVRRMAEALCART